MCPGELIKARNVLSDPYQYFTYDEVDHYLEAFGGERYELSYVVSYDPKIETRAKVQYIELCASFDIETTSLTLKDGKYAFMYVWMFCLQGRTIVGRTWDQFMDLMGRLQYMFQVSRKRRFVIYVHNLSFEFQFMKSLFEFDHVFALASRNPIKALTTDGFEFRCSLALSGLPLAAITIRDDTQPGSVPKLPDRYKYKIHKMIGDLDYGLIRHQNTPLTDTELRYCVADVVTVVHFVADKLAEYGDTLASIPITRTSYVRRDVRMHTAKVKGKEGIRYRATMKSLRLTADDYTRIKEAYMGGFTHANAEWVGVTCRNVKSRDITSSYPTAMVAYKYPMSSFFEIDPNNLDLYKDTHCLLLTVELKGLTSTGSGDHILSLSKCINYRAIQRDPDTVLDNGRIVHCNRAVVTVTDVDWECLSWFYAYDYKILEAYAAYKSYLPTSLVSKILEYYAKKTKLKGVPGEEIMYAKMKEFVNAIYGMTATDVVRKIIDYSGGEWSELDPDKASTLEKTNSSRTRFLFYGWAPWITAYARRRLFEGIKYIGHLYIYTDTDSLKYFSTPEIEAWFEKKNEEILHQLEDACDYHKLSYDLIRPKNRKDEECPLGVWDDDGTYTRFKTLGAKRYMTETMEEIRVDEYDEDGPTGDTIKTGWYTPVIHTTVAGVAKKYLATYLSRQPEPFEAFSDELELPAEWEGFHGKPTHTYIDHEDTLTVTDYLGNVATVHTFGGVHLSNSPYHLNIAYDPELVKAFIYGLGLDILAVEDYT